MVTVSVPHADLCFGMPMEITLNTAFSITTRHTVSNAELFYSDNCTLNNDNTPHSEQLGTVLIRQLFTVQTRASSL